MKKIAIIYLPGNNCENESLRAIKDAGMEADIVRWNQEEKIEHYDGYFIIGGWAYEDRIRAGAIAAKAHIIQAIKKQAEQGKPVLGVCNGAQVLVESGMIPGIQGKVEMALAPNINPLVSGYYCSWVHMKVMNSDCVFTRLCSKDTVMHVPVAHGEGRFTSSDPQLFETLKKNNQIVFAYCTESGQIVDEFPTNPNGSRMNAAGICNPQGNVLALMPHPERAYRQHLTPQGRDPDKKTTVALIFESLAKKK